MIPVEKWKWHASWQIVKYEEGASEPYAVVDIDGNCGLHEGINLLFDLLTGASAEHFDNANAEMGVGDEGDTPAAGAQTGLQALVNTYYTGMMTGYPTSGEFQRVDFRASFPGDQANYAWKELCVRNKTGGVNLNRLVTDLGAKRAGQIWLVRLRIELA